MRPIPLVRRPNLSPLSSTDKKGQAHRRQLTTVVDVEHHGLVTEYIRKDYGSGYCWAVTYSRARDNKTGYDTGDQYPDTCVN
jgi:hypothetical protein